MTAGVEETVFYQRKAQATVHSYSKSYTVSFNRLPSMHYDSIPRFDFLV